MRIRETQTEEEGPVNLMPMIDMVFLLLIFFLVATTFAQEERDLRIQLPGTAAPQPLSAPPQQLIVNIQADGTPIVATKKCTYDELAQLLVRIAREQPDREVLIRADERCLHKYPAAAARICRQVGINEFKIGYILDEPSAQPVE